jgi:hypothetical protein
MNNQRQIEIKFDVHCHHGDELYLPGYRVYLDDDLLTERTFVWSGKNEYIEELATVRLSPGQHLLKVDRINDPRNLLQVENVRINNRRSDFEFFI